MPIDLSPLEFLLFAAAGVGTGIVNTLAGSGSLVTLPIFIFVCGLPAPIANGTNRIGVMVQSAVGVASFRNFKATDFTGAAWIVVPAVVGAVLGSRIAADLDEEAMNTAIGFLMVFMLFVLTVRPERWIHPGTFHPDRNRSPLTMAAFFAIGVYGGFIQAGVGIFLLAGCVLLSGYSLSAANGIKLLVVFAYGLPTLAVFFWQGQVHLAYGLLMAAFQGVGAWLAARFVVRVPNADRWIHRLLILIVAASAIKFLA